ncbi:Leucine-rich repeat-containing protein [Artemisia annua]|uniref:Leucine-rich repeat-containing protein n=1 Tax=Artemisia annua TaxID=35608 RepID=A0A2U1L1B7_ARTAN|nr:Leucine-rich repeat-containing protein [Artemisia annua]
MKNLRLLDIDSDFPSHEPTVLPDELRWLCWHRYPFIALPVARMRNLVGLEMVCSAIKCLWKGPKILPRLKFINLSGSHRITRIPDVSGSPYIERFILANCSSLVEVHESLGCHRKLVYLDMSGCRMLKYLPSTIEMQSLETLILSNCPSLERFPEVSPCMVKLSKIYLDSCNQIKELPSSFRYLSGLSFISLVSCKKLKNIRNSICELKNLKSLYLHNCIRLEILPEELGSMEKLEELLLGFHHRPAFESMLESSKFHTFTSLYSLRKLDLRWRQIEEKDFPRNLHAFSSLVELNLSGNSKLTRLPAGISHISNLKLLEVNECSRLRILDDLPLGIQILKAGGCSSLETIGNFAKDYEWLYMLWLFDCPRILQKQENERSIDRMLELSFIKALARPGFGPGRAGPWHRAPYSGGAPFVLKPNKCAALNHRFSIGIPGSHVPIWFKEARNGCNTVLKLPTSSHRKIMGFAVCGVFDRRWHSQYASPRIIFKIVNEEKMIPMPKEDWANASAVADSENVWISYIPFSFFQKMYHDLQPEDWAHIEGNLVMTITRTDDTQSVKCGAHIVYKEDMESVQESKTWISDYGNLLHVDGDDYQETSCL